MVGSGPTTAQRPIADTWVAGSVLARDPLALDRREWDRRMGVRVRRRRHSAGTRCAALDLSLECSGACAARRLVRSDGLRDVHALTPVRGGDVLSTSIATGSG